MLEHILDIFAGIDGGEASAGGQGAPGRQGGCARHSPGTGENGQAPICSLVGVGGARRQRECIRPLQMQRRTPGIRADFGNHQPPGM